MERDTVLGVAFVPVFTYHQSMYCECGCGGLAPIAARTKTEAGHIKGQPMRFIRGHNNRKERPLCACGCGGHPKDSRAKWVKGHDKRTWNCEEPNPSGLCMCGCGQKTSLAIRTDQTRNWVKGKPVMYIRGHWGRIPDPIPDENGCLIWQGTAHNHGRGMAKSGTGRQDLAYRVWYVKHVGPIPPGHHLHHTCENPMCVRPEHLVPMTPSEHSLLHAAAKKRAV